MQDVCAALPQNTDSARGYTICTAVKFPSGESFFDYITFPDAVTGGEYDAVVLVYAELVAWCTVGKKYFWFGLARRDFPSKRPAQGPGKRPAKYWQKACILQGLSSGKSSETITGTQEYQRPKRDKYFPSFVQLLAGLCSSISRWHCPKRLPCGQLAEHLSIAKVQSYAPKALGWMWEGCPLPQGGLAGPPPEKC